MQQVPQTDVQMEEQNGEYQQPTSMYDMNFTTWDLEVKKAPKLNMETIIKAFDKKTEFFTMNSFLLNAPFIILYRSDCEVDEDLSISNFTERLDIPHVSELVEFYENYYNCFKTGGVNDEYKTSEYNFNYYKKYPKTPIRFLKRLYYIVFYDRDEIHAIDGLGNGVIILPIHGYFLVKLYSEAREEKYHNIITHMFEFVYYR